MDRQPTSYWLTVLLGGPTAGVFCWLFWSGWMAVTTNVRFLHVLFGGGLMYGLVMGLASAAMFALLFLNVRREAPGGDRDIVRDRVMKVAQELRLRVVEDQGSYLRLKPSRGLVKPSCSQVQVWIGADETVVAGPWSIVPTLCKKLDAESKNSA
jgi:hypothetical protein